MHWKYHQRYLCHFVMVSTWKHIMPNTLDGYIYIYYLCILDMQRMFMSPICKLMFTICLHLADLANDDLLSLRLKEAISVKTESKYKHYLWRICPVQNDGHLVLCQLQLVDARWHCQKELLLLLLLDGMDRRCLFCASFMLITFCHWLHRKSWIWSS